MPDLDAVQLRKEARPPSQRQNELFSVRAPRNSRKPVHGYAHMRGRNVVEIAFHWLWRARSRSTGAMSALGEYRFHSNREPPALLSGKNTEGHCLDLAK
jgi:hypothetical protein